jgi:hypothetical protein
MSQQASLARRVQVIALQFAQIYTWRPFPLPHLILGEECTTRSRNGHLWQAAHPGRSEQPKPIPALASARADSVMSLQNHEISALPGQVISDRQDRLSTADHHCIESSLTGGNVHRHPPLVRFSRDTQVGEHLSVASVPGASMPHIGRITC